MMSLIACASPPVDQAGYTPPEIDQGTDGVDSGTSFGGVDAGDGTPPGSGPDGELHLDYLPSVREDARRGTRLQAQETSFSNGCLYSVGEA